MAQARVAVVGAGIAGAGAAWSLTRAGFAVDVFEAAPAPGGNARTHAWPHAGGALTAGLAVLAWPEAYFRNYGRLLEALRVPTEPVRLRFFVRRGEAWYAHELGGPLAERHAVDLARWRRFIAGVRAVSRRFNAGLPSLYRVSYANPMTYLPAWPLARAAGVSRAFWDDVVRAIYGSSLLTTELDHLPAVILPTLDELVSIDDGGRMRTWSADSGQVFRGLLAALDGRLRCGHAVVGVRGDADGVEVRDALGERHRYDHVVLAGDAGSMARALDPAAHAGARRLLSRLRYVEAHDDSFVEGRAHGDASVLPEAHRARILSDYCTYVDVIGDGGRRRYDNHFVVSSWAPVARGTGAVMLVSYGRPPPIGGPVRTFSNRGAHPELSIGNLIVARGLRRHQGRGRVHFCGSYTTPGNGHDLSLLSGFVAAEAIGAPYPFADDPEAASDFALLRASMRG